MSHCGAGGDRRTTPWGTATIIAVRSSEPPTRRRGRFSTSGSAISPVVRRSTHRASSNPSPLVLPLRLSCPSDDLRAPIRRRSSARARRLPADQRAEGRGGGSGGLGADQETEELVARDDGELGHAGFGVGAAGAVDGGVDE